jgi:hypothetical protein
MEVINALCAADQTFIGWVTMVVPCWRTHVIWLETLSEYLCVCISLLLWREYLETFGETWVSFNFILSIPKRIVEHRTSVHSVCVPSRLYGVMVWAGFVDVWKSGCLDSSSWVQDLSVHYLSVMSCNDSYQIICSLTMKIRSCNL